MEKQNLPDQGSGIEVQWVTLTYRSIAVGAVIILLLVGIIAYIISPQFVQRTGSKIASVFPDIPDSWFQTGQVEAASTERQAHFVNLDGEVRIRKANSTEWVKADYRSALGKGDYIQTQGNGMARVIFADGTTYVLKPDTMIVIEESRQDPITRTTRVAVQVSTGAVDLSTGSFSPGSTSSVSFDTAVASLGSDSQAAIRHLPGEDIHEISISQGSAELARDGQTVELGQYERAVFKSDQKGVKRVKMIEPPRLRTPANLEPIISRNPKRQVVKFAWDKVPKATRYHLKVSPSGMFSHMVVDQVVWGTRYSTPGMEEGTYYWVVSSVDAKGQESPESKANRFNLLRHSGEGKVLLEIEKIVQRGGVLEVIGRTEPGSTVIINNEQVFSIGSDGAFRHFMSPVAKPGAYQISITAQNRRGDANTVRKEVVIE